MTADMERAVRALYAESWIARTGPDAPKWEEIPSSTRERFFAMTAAAISAVFLDPSDEVVEAACRAYWVALGRDPDELVGDRPSTAHDRPLWQESKPEVRAVLRAAVMKVLGGEGMSATTGVADPH